MRGDREQVDLSLHLQPLRETSPKSHVPSLLLLGVGVTLGAAVLVLVALKLSAKFGGYHSNLPVAPIRSPEQLRAESVAVYQHFAESGDASQGLGAPEQQDLDEIVALFDHLQACLKAEDDEGLRDLIDFDRLLRRIDQTGSLADWSFLDRRSLRSQLKKQTDTESFWPTIRVVGIVTPPGASHSRVVYTFCQSGEGDRSEDRFWVAKSDGAWKIYDWERLDLGLSTSREYSVYCKYVNSPVLDSYNRWNDLVVEADEHIVEGDYEAAKTSLRLAESQRVPQEMEGYKWLLTSYRWASVDESKQVLRCSRSITDPNSTPGAYYNRMVHQRTTNPSQALASALAYEQTVGPSPDLLEYKVDLLDRMHRGDEAQLTRRMLLRMNPDDSTVLLDYLAALPRDGKSAIDEVLAEFDDPVAAVAGILTSAGYRDYNGLKYLVDYLERAAPNQPATKHAAGTLMQLDGNYEQAATLFRQAFNAEQDSDQRNLYADAYVEVMVDLGQVAEAVQAVPDRQQAIESLLYMVDEGDIELTDNELQAIVDLYARDSPDAWDAIDRQVSLAIDRQQYDEARQLAEEALARMPASNPAAADGDEDEFDEEGYYRQSFEEYVAQASYEQGHLRQAYEGPGDRTDRFEQLARLAVADERWDDVQQLLSWHEGTDPDSAEVLFVRGQWELHQANNQRAIDLFHQGLSKLPENEQWYRKRQFRQLCLDAGDWRAYYTRSDDSHDAFAALASHFIEKHQWSNLNLLVAEHRRREPSDYRLDYVAANAAWEKQDYDAVIRSASLVLKEVEEGDLQSYEQQRLEDRLFTALLCRREWGRARNMAHEKLQDENQSAWMAIYHAARGNHHDAATFAATAASQVDGATQFYSQQLFGKTFLGTQYRELQQEYPVRLPYDAAPTLIVFLAEKAIEVSPKDIEAALGRIRVTAPVNELESFDPAVNQAFVVRFKTGTIWVAAGVGQFNEDWKVANRASPLSAALEQHQGWLAVGVAAWLDEDREQATKVARALAEQLADGRAEAAVARDLHTMYDVAVFPARPELLKTWRESGDLEMLKASSEEVEFDYKPRKLPASRLFERELRQAVVQHESTPDSQLTVWLTATNRPELGPLRLTVTRIKRSYGSLEFEGPLQEASLLLPDLPAGLPISCSEYSVVAWQLDGQPTKHHP